MKRNSSAKPPPLPPPEPRPAVSQAAGPSFAGPATLAAVAVFGGAATLAAVVAVAVFGRRPEEPVPSPPEVALVTAEARSPSRPTSRPAADVPESDPADAPPSASADVGQRGPEQPDSSDPDSAAADRPEIPPPEKPASDPNEGQADVAEPELAEDASGLPGLSLPKAVDLFRGTHVSLDAREGPVADLGPCPENLARTLRVAIALPEHLGASERERITVAAAEPANAGWVIERRVAGLDDDVAEVLATIGAREGRLRIEATADLEATARRLLACSVLLVAAGRGDGGGWQPVRLVVPAAAPPMRFSMLSADVQTTALTLPAALADVGLPRSCSVELVVDEQEVTVDGPEPRPSGDKAGATVTLGPIGPRDTLVLGLTVVPAEEAMSQAILQAEPGLAESRESPADQRKRLRQFAALARKEPDVVLGGLAQQWDIMMARLIEMSPQDAFALSPRELLQKPLPGVRTLPFSSDLEPLEDSFEAFLNHREDQRADFGRGLASSVDEWQFECEEIMERVRWNRQQLDDQRAWQETFRAPLQAWWADYKRDALETLGEALESLHLLADREVEVRVVRIMTAAIGPDGERREIPLVEHRDVAPREAPGGAAGVGLD